MTAMPSLQQIADAIDQRLAEAGQELASLQAARAALLRVPNSQGATRGGAAKDAAPRPTRRSAVKSSVQSQAQSSSSSPPSPRRRRARATAESAAAATSSSPATRTNRASADTGTAARSDRASATAGTATRATSTTARGATAERGSRRGSGRGRSATRDATASAGARTRARTQRGGDRAPAAAASGSSRRRSGELDPAKIEELLRASENGLSLAALAKELGVGAAKIRTQLNELQRSGQVRSEGSRRTSRWRVITDEERIADRVAELERVQASRSTG
jgi:hypothetical protein